MDAVDVERSTAPRAKSAARAIMILELLANSGKGLTFTEISRTMGLPKSSLHELLEILSSRRFIEQDQLGKGYSLGLRVWECGQAYLGQRRLVTEARPVMESIVAALNESTQLAILDGVENVYLDRVDCSQPLRPHTQVGRRLPAHATALGKAMLADLREHEVLERYVDHELVELTYKTITTMPDLLVELRRTRAAGFAIDDEEYAIGLRCVAVPIRDHSGQAIAAMSVSVPRARGASEDLARDLAPLVRGAGEVSRRLGCPAALVEDSFALDQQGVMVTVNDKFGRAGRTRDEVSEFRSR